MEEQNNAIETLDAADDTMMIEQALQDKSIKKQADHIVEGLLEKESTAEGSLFDVSDEYLYNESASDGSESNRSASDRHASTG